MRYKLLERDLENRIGRERRNPCRPTAAALKPGIVPSAMRFGAWRGRTAVWGLSMGHLMTCQRRDLIRNFEKGANDSNCFLGPWKRRTMDHNSETEIGLAVIEVEWPRAGLRAALHTVWMMVWSDVRFAAFGAAGAGIAFAV